MNKFQVFLKEFKEEYNKADTSTQVGLFCMLPLFLFIGFFIIYGLFTHTFAAIILLTIASTFLGAMLLGD